MRFLVLKENRHKSGIYMIACLTNYKVYVGQTNDFKRRYKEHLSDLKSGIHCNYHLQKSVIKYGLDKFVFCVLRICEDSELNSLEQSALNLYIAGNKIDNKICFNESLHVGHPMKGRNHTDDSKYKMSQAVSKKVFQYDLEGNFVVVHPSATKAAKSLGISRAAISATFVNDKRLTAGDYIWLKARNDKLAKQIAILEKTKSSNHSKSIECYDEVEQKILKFDSLKQAKEYFCVGAYLSVLLRHPTRKLANRYTFAFAYA